GGGPRERTGRFAWESLLAEEGDSRGPPEGRWYGDEAIDTGLITPPRWGCRKGQVLRTVGPSAAGAHAGANAPSEARDSRIALMAPSRPRRLGLSPAAAPIRNGRFPPGQPSDRGPR